MADEETPVEEEVEAHKKQLPESEEGGEDVEGHKWAPPGKNVPSKNVPSEADEGGDDVEAHKWAPPGKNVPN